MKSLLITGGAGFIGSNFVGHALEHYTNTKIIVLDKLTYAGNRSYLSEFEDNPNFEFKLGDICDRETLHKLFSSYQFDGVIHFAAESHVDNSISGPDVFIKTNILGTFNVLDCARQLWMDRPFSTKSVFKKARFLHISTDEVYGTLGDTGLFTETTAYAPNSPYSASKAGSDMIVRSYFHTYGMNVVTTNCSNNYGPKQHSEKLIPTIIRKALSEQPIPIYGDGKNIRDWLYVADHCSGIRLAFDRGQAGETYNIGGRNERTNNQIASKICSLLDELRPRKSGKKYSDLIQFVADRPGHDKRYAIDATKIENELHWQAQENFDSGIVKTVKWYLNRI